MDRDLGLVIAIIGHCFAWIWWASKTNTLLSVIKDELKQMNGRMSSEDGKLELKIEAAFKRLEENRERIAKIEAVSGRDSLSESKT